MNRRIAAALLVLLAIMASGCSSSPEETPTRSAAVRIASFDFAESELLAELYAQALEAEGFAVERMGVVGPREVLAPAIELGLIDIVPEYLGTARAYFAPAEGEAIDAESPSDDELFASRGLTLLEPARAQDTNVFVVTADLASRYNLSTISDLAVLPLDRTIGGPVECPDRPLCLAGLESAYELSFAEFVPLASLDITAEALRRGEVDVALMFSTAAQLTPDTLIALEDDKFLQPAENVVPLVRRDALDQWGPELAATLNRLSAALTTEMLRDMNGRIGEGESAASVAAEWLEATDSPPD